jgi:hypothetical protein
MIPTLPPSEAAYNAITGINKCVSRKPISVIKKFSLISRMAFHYITPQTAAGLETRYRKGHYLDSQRRLKLKQGDFQADPHQASLVTS